MTVLSVRDILLLFVHLSAAHRSNSWPCYTHSMWQATTASLDDQVRSCRYVSPRNMCLSTCRTRGTSCCRPQRISASGGPTHAGKSCVPRPATCSISICLPRSMLRYAVELERSSLTCRKEPFSCLRCSQRECTRFSSHAIRILFASENRPAARCEGTYRQEKSRCCGHRGFLRAPMAHEEDPYAVVLEGAGCNPMRASRSP